MYSKCQQMNTKRVAKFCLKDSNKGRICILPLLGIRSRYVFENSISRKTDSCWTNTWKYNILIRKKLRTLPLFLIEEETLKKVETKIQKNKQILWGRRNYFDEHARKILIRRFRFILSNRSIPTSIEGRWVSMIMRKGCTQGGEYIF